MSFPNRKRKIFWLIFSCFMVFLIGYMAWKISQGYHSRKIAGIYLTTGGETFLAIESNLWGSLKVTNGGFHLTNNIMPSQNREFSVKLHNNFLYLSQEENDESISTGSQYTQDGINLTLEPSKNIPGDWDLVKCEILIEEIPKDKIFGKKFFEDLWYSYSIANFEETLNSYTKKRDTIQRKSHYFETPLPSFLHRVDDSRIIEYFRIRQNGLLNKKTLQLARELSDKYPGDPYLALHRIEMEALSGDPFESLKLWEKWKQSYHSHPDPFLQNLAERAFVNASIENNKRRNPDLMNPADFFHWDYENPEKNHDLRETVEYYKQLFHSDHIFFYNLPIVPPLDIPGYHQPWNPNFLQFQNSSKTLRILAAFSLFQGKREEALDLMASIYRLGQSFNSHGTLIQRLMGIHMRAIASEGLQLHVLNACESEDEFKQCWNTLERLINTPHLENSTRFRSYGYPALCAFMESIQYANNPNYDETKTRHNLSDMKFQLVRMACAAKYRLILSGEFPSTTEDFSPFLSEDLPQDVFSQNNPLKFTNISHDEMVVYSIGPDKDDDNATLTYDPTNGALSAGDVIITIPREREYPFPKKGVHAANAYELLQKFPNGLPQDIFIFKEKQPLSIMESTQTEQLVIFSFGPNHDSRDFRPYIMDETHMDLYGSFEPVPTPDPGIDPPHFRRIQKVMRRSDKIPPPPGYWTLEPIYDPTNGVITPGDIFIEIPR